MHVAIEVLVDPQAPAIAREIVASALADVPISPERFEDLRLLTSEIVTNALRHAGLESGESIGLGVEVSEDRIRVKVTDDGPGFDPSNFPGLPLNGRVDGGCISLRSCRTNGA